MHLISESLEQFRFYKSGIISHLCNFLLLQITDILCQNNQEVSICIKRTDEIFRNFKKLSSHNYRKHHDILFYANNLNISTPYLSRRLLDTTDMGIKEIADELDFSDQSVFGKFFVKATGVSPLKYRKR